MPPPSLPPERAKVADFYAARSATIPPLPWQTFAPPFPKLFIEAQALISVPSTEKCSSDSSGATSRWASTVARNLRENPCCPAAHRGSCVKTVATQPGHRRPRPTNQRNNRLCSVRLHQLPLPPHRKKGFDQAGPDQPLGRDGRPAFDRVQPIELGIEARQHLVHDPLDLPQRMPRRDAFLEIDIAEQRSALLSVPRILTPASAVTG